MFYQAIRKFLLLLITANIMGCGQSGPLYLPERESNSAASLIRHASE